MSLFNKKVDLNEPIAVVGMGCCFPGGKDTNEFWDSIARNDCFIRPLTERYTGVPQVYDPDPSAWNKSHSNLGAPVGPFEFPYHEFRGLPPSALEACDYHFKFGLMAAREAIVDSSLSQKELASAFVSVGANAYETPMMKEYCNSGIYLKLGELEKTQAFQTLEPDEQERLLNDIKKKHFRDNEAISVDLLTGSMSISMAARIAKLNKITGGHLAVDSACASSFAALDIAVKRLRSHTNDVVIAGGASGITPFFYVYCSKAKTMSAKGSFPFDKDASGFVVGEGAGFVVLKRLSEALKGKNKIHAVISGVGTSSDGSKTGPWAPCKEGQKMAVERALKQTKHSIADVQYIECHGTGTVAGDAMELNGIKDLLGAEFSGKIKVGSAKGAIGHLLTAAGAAGLIRTILCIKNKQYPGTAGLNNINNTLAEPNCPLEVSTAGTPWNRAHADTPLRAMVNSFGFGGTNYSAQIEEFDLNYHSHYLRGDNHRFNYNQLSYHNPGLINSENLGEVYNQPIAIVAMAVDVAGANTLDQLEENIEQKKSHLIPPPKERWDVRDFYSAKPVKWKTQSYKGGFVKIPEEKEKYKWKIPPVSLKFIDPNQFRLFGVVKEALEKAKLIDNKETLKNTGMIAGNMMDSDFFFAEHIAQRFNYLEDFIRRNCDYLSSHKREKLIDQFRSSLKEQLHTFGQDNSISGIDSMCASRVAKFFDIKGGTMSMDCVCATGILAIDHAMNSLRDGTLQAAVVCSSNMGMSGQLFATYNDLTALSKKNYPTPFSEGRDGMVLGEGAVCLILKRLDQALQDKDSIHALIHSTGTSGDGLALQMVTPEKATVKMAFKNCLARFAGPQPPVEYIDCHGSSTPAGDKVEMECSREVYGEQNKVTLSSLKPNIGHIKVAAAFASTVKMSLALSKKKKYPTTNLGKLDPYILENQNCIEVNSETKPFDTATPFGAVNAMGLGGINGHMIMQSFDAHYWHKAQGNETKVVRAESGEKISITANSTKEFNLRVDKVTKLIQSGAPAKAIETLRKNNIFVVNEDALKGKKVFLFPGQSSAYAEMYKDLFLGEPILKAFLDKADAFCISKKVTPLSQVLYEKDHWHQLKQLYHSQLAPFVIQVALGKYTLEYLGIKPDLLLGHSVGEVAAFCLAGIFDFETGLNILNDRYEVVSKIYNKQNPAARMMVIRMNESEAKKLVSGVPHVYVANTNGPEQTVLAGYKTSLEIIKTHLDKQGIDNKILAVAGAFHCALLAPVVNEFKQRLMKYKFLVPQIPITSLVFNDCLAGPEQVPHALAEALVSPVQFMQLLDLARSRGMTQFIDMGPGWPLKSMVGAYWSDEQWYKTFYLNHPKEKSTEALDRFRLEIENYSENKKRAPLVSGSAEQRGQIFGEYWKERFTDYEWVYERFPEKVKATKPVAMSNLMECLPQNYLDELNGLAKGANTTIEQVYLVNCLTSMATSMYGMCSGVINDFSHGGNYDGPFIRAQDAERLPRNVFQVNNSDCFSYMGVFNLGSPFPYTGINEHGISITTCAGSPPEKINKGIYVHAYTRLLLENCQNLEQVQQYFQKEQLEGSWIFLVYSQSEKRGIKIEAMGDTINVQKNPNQLFATNHFQEINDGKDIREDSLIRLKRLRMLLETERKVQGGVQNILSDGYDLEKGKVTKFPTTNTLNRYNTCVSVIYPKNEISLSVSCDKIPSGTGPYTHYEWTPSNTIGPAKEGGTYRWGKRLGKELKPEKIETLCDQFVILVEDPKDLKKQLLEQQIGKRYVITSINQPIPQVHGNYYLIDLIKAEKGKTDVLDSVTTFKRKADFIRKLLQKNSKVEGVSVVGFLPLPGEKGTQAFLCAESILSEGFYKSLHYDQNLKGSHFISLAPGMKLKMFLPHLQKFLGKTSGTKTVHFVSGRLYPERKVLLSKGQNRRENLPLAGDTILITGGAGGVTAEIGLDLAREFPNCRFILVGRSDLGKIFQGDRTKFLMKMRKKSPGLKPVDYLSMWERNQRKLATQENIKRYKKLCKKVSYLTCDLSDKNNLERLIAQIGRIDHVIHGAGTQRSKKFLEKRIEEFNQIVDSKTINTLNLIFGLSKQKIKSFYSFGSVSGENGNIGQTDYSAANSFHAQLNGLVKQVLGESCTYRCISWPAWGETGMAMDPAVHAEMKAANIDFIKIKEGVHFFKDEFLYESWENSVICTPASDDATSSGTGYTDIAQRKVLQKANERAKNLAWIDHIISPLPNARAEIQFSGREQFLQDHVVRGVPVLPGVVLTEIVIQTLSVLGFSLGSFEIEQVQFFSSAKVDPKWGQTFSINIIQETSRLKFYLEAPIRRSDGVILKMNQVLCQGTITIANKNIQRPMRKIGQEHKVLQNKNEFYQKLLSMFPEHLGESFQTLEQVHEGTRDKVLASATYKGNASFGKGRYFLHPEIFDLINHSVIAFENDLEEQLPYLPYKFSGVIPTKELQQGEKYFISLENRQDIGDEIRFSASILDRNGSSCCHIREVVHKRYQS